MSIAIRALIATAILFAFSINANAAKDAVLSADAQAIDTACKADAATAGCGAEIVGKGLLKCMGSYKKMHKDFKFSADCREAMKQMKRDRDARK